MLHPHCATAVRCHISAVAKVVLRRLLLVLNLVLATVLSGAVSAMPHAEPVMVQNLGHRCADCPPPKQTGKKMLPCNSMRACLAVVTALPPENEALLPGFSGTAYLAEATPTLSGKTLAPDPFPPRPLVLP